jgi:hypothetical protein
MLNSRLNCNQKRGSKNTQHTDCLQRTQASMSSWSTRHSSDLRSIHNTLTAYWIITRSKTYKCFASISTTKQILQHPSPASPIHTDVNKGKLSHYITDYTHFPKAQAFFPSNVHKNTSFPVLCSLSLSFLCNSSTDYQAQRKVLAFSQAILAHRTFHRYVKKRSPLLPPKPLKVSWSYSSNYLLHQNQTSYLSSPSNYLSIPHTSSPLSLTS